MCHSTCRRALGDHRRALVALFIGMAFIVAGCGQSSSTPGATKTPSPPHTWRLSQSPNPPNPAPDQPLGSLFFGVSAASPAEGWAVGVSMVDDQGPHDLIEHWNGTAWSIVASPDHGVLWAVAAVSPNDVWAVGGISSTSIFDSLPTNTQILHWNGTAWSAVPSPNPGSKSNQLSSVVALSATDVWAVGSFSGADGVERPLIERWDGTAWHVVASPAPPGSGRSVLSAITRVPGTKQLWAVGTTSMTTDPNVTNDQVLTERWDGATWSLVSAPALPQGTQGCMVQGVTAPSATDAWLIGGYSAAADQPSKPLIARWNGSMWKIVSGAVTEGRLSGIAASGTTDVRAVGGVPDSNGHQSPLIEEWDGTAWKVATSPSLSTSAEGEGFLTAATADNAGNFWAVGAARDTVGPESVFRTVVARWP
jgi:hypothetical protein